MSFHYALASRRLTLAARSPLPLLNMQSIYYVGGFGNEHFIGYVPVDKYQVAQPSEKDSFVGLGGRFKLVTQE